MNLPETKSCPNCPLRRWFNEVRNDTSLYMRVEREDMLRKLRPIYRNLYEGNPNYEIILNWYLDGFITAPDIVRCFNLYTSPIL